MFEQPGRANTRKRREQSDTRHWIEQQKLQGTYRPHAAFALEDLIENARKGKS